MSDAESNLLASIQALIERDVNRRVRPLEGLLRKAAVGKTNLTEEFLDVNELAISIHTEPKTIRDWVHKKKIPFEKLPTGGIRFAWSKVEAWVKSKES